MTVDQFDVLERIVLQAADHRTRGRTLTHLAETHRGTRDPKIAGLLARVVRNEGETKDVRLIAYFVLFEVAGRPLQQIPPLDQLSFPEGLDWAFVDSYL
jgi:hypothetical protein